MVSDVNLHPYTAAESALAAMETELSRARRQLAGQHCDPRSEDEVFSWDDRFSWSDRSEDPGEEADVLSEDCEKLSDDIGAAARVDCEHLSDEEVGDLLDYLKVRFILGFINITHSLQAASPGRPCPGGR